MLGRDQSKRGKPIIDLSFWQRLSILIGLVVVGLVGLFALDPIPQDPNYHLFADTRSFFSIPHFNDVGSNAGFAEGKKTTSIKL